LTQQETKACGHARPPKVRTAPCARFFQSHDELFNFLTHFTQLTVKIVERALPTSSNLDKEELERGFRAGAAATKRFFEFERLLLEVLLCRSVDNFVTYLSEALALAYRHQPNMLRTDEKVAYKELIGLTSREDLVTYLAERKVHRLSYSSLEDLATTLEHQHGLTLFSDRAEMARASSLNATRNLLVHNRGRVNRAYLTLVPAWEVAPIK
jgi:hypothetical protein